MVSTILWPLAVLILGIAIIWRVDHQVTARFNLDCRRQEAAKEKMAVELLERRNAAELAERTSEERAELERAKLLRDTADVRLEAEVLQATLPDRIEAEKKVIEASVEARKLAASQRTTHTSEDMEALAGAYQAYAECEPGRLMSFGQWMQGFQLPH